MQTYRGSESEHKGVVDFGDHFFGSLIIETKTHVVIYHHGSSNLTPWTKLCRQHANVHCTHTYTKHPIGFYAIWRTKHPNRDLASFEVRNIQLGFTSFEVWNKHPIGFYFVWSEKHPIGFYIISSAKHLNWIWFDLKWETYNWISLHLKC